MFRYCTLTGVDEKTSFEWLADVSRRHPFVEWGVLLSLSPEDKDERYGPMSLIEAFAGHSWPTGFNSALHVCGRAVNSFVSGGDGVRELASNFGRVQLNFNLGRARFGIRELDRAIQTFGGIVITQHNGANAEVARSVTAGNHDVLFDVSGGRGLRTTAWPERPNGKVYGYAGGFGPETVADDLEGAHLAAKGEPYWIDMETRLRADGYLSRKICEQVLETVEAKLAQLNEDTGNKRLAKHR